VSNLSFREILRLMPHRYPFLLIDSILDYQEGDSLKAIKNVSFNEPFFVGHFPENPVMPGVLILEALAQATAFLALKTLESRNELKGENWVFLFAGLDDVRFRSPVFPGDQLELEVKLGKSKHGIYRSTGCAKVGDNVVCTAALLAAYREVGA
jgi:3-hydroxyacyl-[acyl-carrier-protein] dehydratase